MEMKTMSRTDSELVIEIVDQLIEDVLRHVVQSMVHEQATNVSIASSAINCKATESEIGAYPQLSKRSAISDGYRKSHDDLAQFVKAMDEQMREHETDDEMEEHTEEIKVCESQAVHETAKALEAKALDSLRMMQQIEVIEEEAARLTDDSVSEEPDDALLDLIMEQHNDDTHEEYDFAEFKQAVLEQQSEQIKPKVETQRSDKTAQILYATSIVVLMVAAILEFICHDRGSK